MSPEGRSAMARNPLALAAFALLLATSVRASAAESGDRFYLPGQPGRPATSHLPTDAKEGSLEAPLPVTISLNGDWDFYYDGVTEAKRRGIGYARSAKVAELPAEGAYETRMPVPGYWDDHLRNLQGTSWWFWAQFNRNTRPIDFPMGGKYVPPFANLPYLVGTGFYRKTLEVPQQWHGKRLVLLIGGVVAEAVVYCNGRRVGERRDYLTPGEFDLSDQIHPGTNEVIIAVSNRETHTTAIPMCCAIDGYHGFSGGIYGGVSLKINALPSVKEFYVYPDTNRLCWQAEIEGLAENAFIDWSVQDREGGTNVQTGRLPLGGEKVSWTSDPMLLQKWSEKNPKLYELEVQVVAGGVVQHKLRQKFGWRRLESRDGNLFMNGKALMLRGTCETWYYPETCTAPSDLAAYARIIKRYQELGFNWLRFHTALPRQEFLEAADCLGMLVQVEGPRDADEQTWVSILKAARKHPSVILYCVTNEQLLDEPAIKTVARRHELLKQYVPDALFSPMQALRGVEYGAGVEDFGTDYRTEPYLHNPRRLEELKKSADVFQPTGWGYFSFRSATEVNLDEIDQRLAGFERPCTLHEVGIHGTYLDIGLARRYQNTRIGTGLFDAVTKYLDENGLLSKAQTYYANSCRWANNLRKHALERARLCNHVKGYDFLGAVDCHWMFVGYTCGIMNEFLELKPGQSVQNVLNYNGESVLLADLDTQRNFSASGSLDTHLFGSLYGEQPLKDALLYWNVKDDTGKSYASEVKSVAYLPTAGVSKMADIHVPLARFNKATKLHLTAKLLSAEYDLQNDWAVWVFPEVNFEDLNFDTDKKTARRLPLLERHEAKKLASGKLQVISQWSNEALDFLASGGRVLLLGPGPFATAPTSFQIAPAGRVTGNLATIIAEHPLFSEFPHDGFCDWQFYHLLNDGNAVVFQDERVPFDPILEVASSYKLLKKQAAIFELRVGAGSLLLTSLNLRVDDPAGRFLLYRLIRYASSNAFEPKNSIDPVLLSALPKPSSHN